MEVTTPAGKLSAEVVNALADKAGGPVGRLLGIPVDGEDDTVALRKKDIATARGGMAFRERGDWDNAGSAVTNLESKRFGAAPPARPLWGEGT